MALCNCITNGTSLLRRQVDNSNQGTMSIKLNCMPRAAHSYSSTALHSSSSIRICRLSSSLKPTMPSQSRRSQLVCRAAADDSELVEDTTFRIEKISFGSILTPIGVFLLAYGFGSFFQLLPGSDIAAIELIYGFPIALLGFALSYAQLRPVPCKTTKKAFELRDTQMTDIQKQLREDVTRFRYGDEQHLDEPLDKIFRLGKPKGLPRRFTPVLVGLREEVVDGAYTLVLEFQTKKEMELQTWLDKQEKIQTFFGPGVVAKIEQTEQGADVYLISDKTGAGRGGAEKKDMLPPLMPGLKARSQD